MFVPVLCSRLPDHTFDACGHAKSNQNPPCQELLKKGPKMASEAISEHQIFLGSMRPKDPPSWCVLTHARSAGPIHSAGPVLSLIATKYNSRDDPSLN